jgi:hypothetical protein
MPPKAKRTSKKQKASALARKKAKPTNGTDEEDTITEPVAVSQLKSPPPAPAPAPPQPNTSTPATPPTVATASHASNRVATPTTVDTAVVVPVGQVNIPAVGTGRNDDTNDDLTQDRSATSTFRDIMLKTADTNALRVNVRNYVTQEFFPHVKFITRKSKLAYFDATRNPNTYCAVITKGCHLPPGMNPVSWWETVARKEVKKKISQLRSGKLSALKWAYFSKYHWVRVCLF